MILLDSLIILGLILDRQHWSSPLVLPGRRQNRVANFISLAFVAGLVLSITLFGSPFAALNYAYGATVTVKSPEQFAGVASPGETVAATFLLRNTSNVDVTVVGAKTSCGCLTVNELPLKLAPKESISFQIQLSAGRREGLQVEIAELFFNDSSPNLGIGVTILVKNRYASNY